MNTTDAQTIANTTHAQLGGKRFDLMVGTTTKSFDKNGELKIKFKARAKQGINFVSIELDPSDTYTVEFGRINYRTFEYDVKLTVCDVYCDQLAMVFEHVTGLYTRI